MPKNHKSESLACFVREWLGCYCYSVESQRFGCTAWSARAGLKVKRNQGRLRLFETTVLLVVVYTATVRRSDGGTAVDFDRRPLDS